MIWKMRDLAFENKIAMKLRKKHTSWKGMVLENNDVTKWLVIIGDGHVKHVDDAVDWEAKMVGEA